MSEVYQMMKGGKYIPVEYDNPTLHDTDNNIIGKFDGTLQLKLKLMFYLMTI